MKRMFQPWQLLVTILAGWITEQQQQLIEYLRTENRVLKELHGKKRLLLTDDQRRRLAVPGKALGRKLLGEIGTLVSPDTILRWHRQLIAEKWDYSDRRQNKPGRPPITDEVRALALKLAKENPSWGYDRIQGAVANLGHTDSDTTVGNILKQNGIEPAPQRKRRTTWKTFLQAHWEALAAVDFTTIEVWTKGGLVTYYLLFVLELATRRVHFAGLTPSPDGPWMTQVARNLTDYQDGFLNGKRYLLLDRDTKFTESFAHVLEQADVKCLRLPPRSPNLNAHLERFMRSIKEECLSGLIFFGEHSLRRAVAAFLEHYHRERNHQGLENRIVAPSAEVGAVIGKIECRERLGGMLRYYYRGAA